VTDDLTELVTLVNARLPADSPFRIDPTRRVVFSRCGSLYYWALTDGTVRHQWEPEADVPAPHTALQRILAGERRAAAARPEPR